MRRSPKGSRVSFAAPASSVMFGRRPGPASADSAGRPASLKRSRLVAIRTVILRNDDVLASADRTRGLLGAVGLALSGVQGAHAQAARRRHSEGIRPGNRAADDRILHRVVSLRRAKTMAAARLRTGFGRPRG